jgi:hypothetical protein
MSDAMIISAILAFLFLFAEIKIQKPAFLNLGVRCHKPVGFWCQVSGVSKKMTGCEI